MAMNLKLQRKAKEKNLNLLLNYNASEIFLNLLSEVLTEELENAILKSESEEILHSPNYVQAHADLVGYRKGLRFVLKLIETPQGNKDD